MVPAHLREGGGNTASDIVEFRSTWVYGGRNQEMGERQRKRNQVRETEKRERVCGTAQRRGPQHRAGPGPSDPTRAQGPCLDVVVSPLQD